jgi:hypothetical protein
MLTWEPFKTTYPNLHQPMMIIDTNQTMEPKQSTIPHLSLNSVLIISILMWLIHIMTLQTKIFLWEKRSTSSMGLCINADN